MLIKFTCILCGKPCLRNPARRKRYCSTDCFNVGRVRSTAALLGRRTRRTASCWVSTASVDNKGYPRVWVAAYGRAVPAARAAWYAATGEVLTSAEHILHTCDTPACVRNDDVGTYVIGDRVLPRRGHLVRGTNADNVRDKVQKGRAGPPDGSRGCDELSPKGDSFCAYARGIPPR